MDSNSEKAVKLAVEGPHKVEKTPRRVRGFFDHEWVFDTTDAHFVWEHPYYPLYYIPENAFKSGFLTRNAPNADGLSSGILKGEHKSTDQVLIFEKGPLSGLVRIEVTALDAWFEEEEPIYAHPKDPYKRIDILPSCRNITVKIDGVTIAESSSNMFLFETMLRPRYYLPKTSLQWRYLRESDTTTRCSYKGVANYYTAVINGKEYKDVVWWYKYPTAESARISNLACFYNEKVDVFIDGVLEAK
ncbi:MAG: hypothetical protein Q9195_002028 [Heterodermia aff. obscurata]